MARRHPQQWHHPNQSDKFGHSNTRPTHAFNHEENRSKVEIENLKFLKGHGADFTIRVICDQFPVNANILNI